MTDTAVEVVKLFPFLQVLDRAIRILLVSLRPSGKAQENEAQTDVQDETPRRRMVEIFHELAPKRYQLRVFTRTGSWLGGPTCTGWPRLENSDDPNCPIAHADDPPVPDYTRCRAGCNRQGAEGQAAVLLSRLSALVWRLAWQLAWQLAVSWSVAGPSLAFGALKVRLAIFWRGDEVLSWGSSSPG